MLTNFKNREQLEQEKFEKEMESLKHYYSENDHSRLVRIFKDEACGTDRLFASNNLIKIKFELRKIYLNLDKLQQNRRDIKRLLGNDADKLHQEFYNDYLNNLNDYIKNLEKMIFHYGGMIVNFYIPMLDKYFSEHEIIQIIGGSYEQCKRIKKFYDKHNTGTRSLTDSLIIHHGEYRWRRGLSKDFIDCPRWEMPLFECVTKYMWQAINNNPKASVDLDNVFEDMFGDAMSHITTDNQGNIISSEKIYKNLTVNELIKDYHGQFINKLKSKNVLDNETTYKIKRIDDGVYDVISEDKKALARIYKKTN